MNYYVVVDELQDPDGITEWTYLIETKTSCKLNVPNAKLTKKNTSNYINLLMKKICGK